MADTPNSTNEPISLEAAAALRFDGVKADPPLPFPSVNEWWDRARDAYPIYYLTTHLLGLSDEELETVFQKNDFETFVEFVEACQSLVDTERAGVEMLDAIIARSLIIGSREAVRTA